MRAQQEIAELCRTNRGFRDGYYAWRAVRVFAPWIATDRRARYDRWLMTIDAIMTGVVLRGALGGLR